MLMSIGLLVLYSASFNNVRVSQQVFFDQLYCALISIGIMYSLSRVDFRRFYDLSYILYGVSIFMLLVVLVGGRHALGARRWLEVGGFSFQPSEVTKLCMIFCLGRYFSHRKARLSFNIYSKLETFWHDFLFPGNAQRGHDRGSAKSRSLAFGKSGGRNCGARPAGCICHL